jgi:hypothetical protein
MDDPRTQPEDRHDVGGPWSEVAIDTGHPLAADLILFGKGGGDYLRHRTGWKGRETGGRDGRLGGDDGGRVDDRGPEDLFDEPDEANG